jgi:sulfide:quinone oxidoreductase
MRSRIVVVGSSFAGYTAALSLKRQLGDAHDVVVIAESDEFLFSPALALVPFGLRDRDAISFPVRVAFDKAHIVFKQAPVVALDVAARRVKTAVAFEAYDYLVLATGARPEFDAGSGLDPNTGFVQSILTWDDACRARVAFDLLVRKPGPIVVGALPNASCLDMVYEFLFTLVHQLPKRGLASRAPITFVTPEPYVGYLGVGGVSATAKTVDAFFRKHDVTAITNASVVRAERGALHLGDGRVLPSAFSMLGPPSMGATAVRTSPVATDESGFVRVDEYYRTLDYPEVFAAGAAVALEPLAQTAAPCATPRSGYFAEETARVVAHNVAASLCGESLLALSPRAIDAQYVLDASSEDDAVRAYTPHAPGPHRAWARRAFSRYFKDSRRIDD